MFRSYIVLLVSFAWICLYFHGFIGCPGVMYYYQITIISVKSYSFILFRLLNRTIFKKILLPLHHENKNSVQGHQPFQIQQILPKRRGLLWLFGRYKVERWLFRLQAVWQYTLLQRTAAFREAMHKMQIWWKSDSGNHIWQNQNPSSHSIPYSLWYVYC